MAIWIWWFQFLLWWWLASGFIKYLDWSEKGIPDMEALLFLVRFWELSCLNGWGISTFGQTCTGIADRLQMPERKPISGFSTVGGHSIRIPWLLTEEWREWFGLRSGRSAIRSFFSSTKDRVALMPLFKGACDRVPRYLECGAFPGVSRFHICNQFDPDNLHLSLAITKWSRPQNLY